MTPMFYTITYKVIFAGFPAKKVLTVVAASRCHHAVSEERNAGRRRLTLDYAHGPRVHRSRRYGTLLRSPATGRANSERYGRSLEGRDVSHSPCTRHMLELTGTQACLLSTERMALYRQAFRKDWYTTASTLAG